jgi:hypothetical protein
MILDNLQIISSQGRPKTEIGSPRVMSNGPQHYGLSFRVAGKDSLSCEIGVVNTSWQVLII